MARKCLQARENKRLKLVNKYLELRKELKKNVDYDCRNYQKIHHR